NDETIEQEQYTFDDITINYTFAKPNPEEFVFVEVTFDLDGGVWTKNILNDMTPDQSLVVTTKDDIGGKTFTILDDKATAYRYFYKIFLKLDEKTDLYQVVAVDNARGHIINLDLPEYNYVLAVHDDCNDKDALNVIKNYIKSNDDNLYVLFDKDPYSFENNLKVNFYKEDSVFGVYNITLFDEVDLPIPYRHEFNFIGWSDGENIYTTFPRYQLKDGITKVTYKAVWESFSLDDFKNLINSILPKEIESDVELPTSFSNYTISWSSSHEDVVTNMGKFTKPYKDTKVTLIATLKSKNGEEKQMSFEVFAKGYKELKNGIASSYIYRNYNLVTDEFFETLDIINCAFITADSAGRLSGSNFLSNVKNYILPKARENGNWVIMSVAPNPDTKWSKIAANPATVEAFANNIVKVINEYGFDGVDIDWETPTSSEAKLFTALMKVVYQKVKANNPNHLVTAAIAGGMWQPPRYDLINSQKYIDYINMMTYGMVSSNGQYQNALYRSTSSHNTKFGVGKTLTSCSIHESIEIYNNDFNIPNHKIIVGVAFYGLKQTYTNGAWKGAGSVFYTNIKKSYINNSLYTEYYDEKAEVPYILKNDGTEFISYDNPRSVLAKCEYVLDNGLGGIMYWENGCDSTGDLLAAMKLGLNK
ncbi:MAG TPA: hypothetical protein GXZ48_00400, partial [Acholeplasmataceae bacterium]|nr:hypothetical protein [Acholeplasmataceae bacterium]